MSTLVSAFDKVKTVKMNQEIMCLDPKRIPVSIDDIKWVIEQYSELPIKMTAVQAELTYLYGLMERYTSYAQIYMRADQGLYMMRYTATKELSHILIDTEDDWHPDGSETLDSLLMQHASPGEVDNNVRSENLAGFVATELLYPHEFRRRDAEQVERGEASLESLSVHYQVPPHIVGPAIHPIYLDITDKIWAQVP